ncbi:UDP-glucose dehydrogenase family protein [Rubrimonas sp.]|uniref:UDP-glucose dehydrogenase family protein n=1 Tax=Rubrimonas sp. TaxID=2036015 RepID=UPI002FDD0E2D
MRVSVVGTGYVGLVSGVCLAAKGHDVTCVDLDRVKVARINAGDPPIYELGLEELLKAHVGRSLRATDDLAAAVRDTEISLIAVGTPFDGSEIDLKYVRAVAAEIGAALRDKPAYHMVVVKSTVVPGTTEDVVLPILQAASGKRAGPDFGVGMNPEFLKEGEAIADFMEPDRIVLGGIDARAIAALEDLYAAFPDVDKIRTDPRTAEMIKYTANSLLATLISFSNEIGNLCAKVGVDVVDAMAGVHLDKRFSPVMPDGSRVRPSSLAYLAAGCGFGGSCFPKDVKALIAYGQAAGAPMGLLRSVIEVNEAQPAKMLEMLARHCPDLAGRRIAVLGMAFKPGTDDIRESPSLPVTARLLEQGAKVAAYDPIARHEAEKIFGEAVDFRDDLAAALDGAEAILVMTRWPQFEALPALLKDRTDPPLVIDGRRMLPKTDVPRYEGIGLKGA